MTFRSALAAAGFVFALVASAAAQKSTTRERLTAKIRSEHQSLFGSGSSWGTIGNDSRRVFQNDQRQGRA